MRMRQKGVLLSRAFAVILGEVKGREETVGGRGFTGATQGPVQFRHHTSLPYLVRSHGNRLDCLVRTGFTPVYQAISRSHPLQYRPRL
jgi:hypothetical protein